MTSTTPIREDGEQEQLDVNDPNQRSLLDRSKTRQHSAALSAFSTPGIVVNNDDILHELPDGSSLLAATSAVHVRGKIELRVCATASPTLYPRLSSLSPAQIANPPAGS